MRAKKVSRVVGFVFVVAAAGGIGATAWGSEVEPTPAPVVVDSTDVSPSPSVAPSAPSDGSDDEARTLDTTWT